MTVDWNHYTPWASLGGGLLIGAATALYLLGTGRIAGIAGIVAGPLRALVGVVAGAGTGSSQRVPLFFIAGLLIAPHLWRLVAPLPAVSVDVGPVGLVVAGLLVGVGVRMANGCTSGHGVCGLSRFSLRSLVNVIAFMGAGAVTVFVLRHLV